MGKLSRDTAEHQYDSDEAEDKICEWGEHEYETIINDSDTTNTIERYWCKKCEHWIEELSRTSGMRAYNKDKQQVYETFW